MKTHDARFVPPFCPNHECPQHREPFDWRWKRFGHYTRAVAPRRIQRFRCLDCWRCFSTQSFDTTYWLKRPDLQPAIFQGLVQCSGYRQLARGLGVVHSTVLRQAERLGRHCLLFQHRNAPARLPDESLVLDGLRTFEYSQYWPCDFNLLIGARTHFLHGFTDAELRRSGAMRPEQKARRAELEARHGRPDPRATKKEVETLLRLHVPPGVPLTLHTDEQRDYRWSLARLEDWTITHVRTSSKAPRTPQNPLFPANLADLLIRHSSANHKRETIAFSKRRQGAAERLAVFQVWRNYIKRRSERDPRGPTPAMLAGAATRVLGLADVLRRRLFPWRVRLPARIQQYYERQVETRQVPNGRRHELTYAF